MGKGTAGLLETVYLVRQGFVEALKRINEWTGRAVAWFAVLMVLVTFLIVVLRYSLNINSIAIQELVVYLHSAMFMLGAAYTLKHDEHVRVDIFLRRFSKRTAAIVEIAGVFLLLLPTCLFIFWVSLDYVAASWSILEGSRESGGMPGVFLVKTLIPLSMALLALQGLLIFIDKLAVLRGNKT